MAKNTNDALIGRAWGAHRAGNNSEAIRDFEQVLKAEKDNVDAYYGLGLAQRASGQYEAARTAFEKARELAEQKKDVLQGGKQENNLETLEDDRYMMLIRMIGQRLEELEAKAGK